MDVGKTISFNRGTGNQTYEKFRTHDKITEQRLNQRSLSSLTLRCQINARPQLINFFSFDGKNENFKSIYLEFGHLFYAPKLSGVSHQKRKVSRAYAPPMWYSFENLQENLSNFADPALIKTPAYQALQSTGN